MPAKYVLLAIDMQQVAFDGKITPPINDGAQVLKNVGEVISQCRSAGIQILYVKTKALSGRPYAEDSHGWEIHPSLTPQQADLTVYKQGSSGFEDTTLEQNGGHPLTNNPFNNSCAQSRIRIRPDGAIKTSGPKSIAIGITVEG